MSTISPGSSVRQGFDHLAERNLALYRRHRDVLESEASAAFPLKDRE
jgi:deaminated glutathione amidase